MSVDWILWAACKGGHAYIFKEFYEISGKLIPDSDDLEEAAKRGHWDIIKWAIDNGITNEKGDFLFFAILNGHFEFIQLFENEYNFKIDINSKITRELYGPGFTRGINVQALANKAAELGKSKVVEWISDRFNVLPEKHKLSGATVRILKLLKLKKPETFDADLLKRINQMSSIKWMWNNYDGLFANKMKKKWTNGDRNGKELRWIHKNWKMLPKSVRWNISVEDLEFFMEATGGKVDVSGVAECAVREGDFGKIQYLISKHPSCLEIELVDTARGLGHMEIVNILGKHFGHQSFDLWYACTSGHLEILKQSIKSHRYSLDEIKDGVLDAIKYDQLEIVDYMMNKGYVDADKAKSYMGTAIVWDSICVFKLLIKIFGEDKLPEGYLMEYWENKSLKIFKFILPRLSKSELEVLLGKNFNSRNYHLRIIVKEEYEKRI